MGKGTHRKIQIRTRSIIMAAIDKRSDKMAWGMTLLAFGVLILLDKTGITDNLPFTDFIQSIGTYFLVAGIIFLIYRMEKTLGLLFTVIGLIIHSDVFFGWMKDYRNLLLPVALLVIGLILILSNRRR